MTEPILKFIKRRDYKLVKELGAGACGKTVLLFDDLLDQHVVCKKYAPQLDILRVELFQNFMREIKLLYALLHPNVVRVYFHFLYPEDFAGFILMEYVDGIDVDDYLKANPDKLSNVFAQTIEGFCHLEACGVLHRDVRPKNIMVREDGVVKIIDLGFGKQIKQSDDFDKSITLNWWCEPPDEFENVTYNFGTEVYFVGKLFERVILESGLDNFEHMDVIARMCRKNPAQRLEKFSEVRRITATSKFDEIDFDWDDVQIYRSFADQFAGRITKIEGSAKYYDDLDKLKSKLEDLLRKVMLEEYMPDAAPLLRCFIDGTYYYKKQRFPVQDLRDFLRLYTRSTIEQKRVLLANLHTRLDAVTRYELPAFGAGYGSLDDEIPF